MEHFSEALQCFGQAADLEPDEALFQYNSGMAHKALRRYEEAIASFNAAIKLRGNYVDAYKQLTAVTAMGLIMKGLRRPPAREEDVEREASKQS